MSPASIAAIYGLGAVIYAVVITLIFALMIVAGFIVETKMAVMVFALIGVIPAVFIFLAVFLRPNEPVSRLIKSFADSCRRPLPLAPDDCTFKMHLMDGETLCIKLCFLYPARDRSADLKERLYTIVHGSLAQDFSTRVIVPTYKEIESALDKPLTLLAEERDIPVFYPEIRDVFCARDEPQAQASYVTTGTWS